MNDLKQLLSLDSKERIRIINTVLTLRKKVLGKDFDENEAEDIESMIQELLKKSGQDSNEEGKTKGLSFEQAVKSWVNRQKQGLS
jgi:hypothetical protein